MKAIMYIIILSLLLSAGCHSREKENKGASTPEKEVVKSFKRIENLRFGFMAKIPAGWKANDTSDNGDGFIITLPPGHEKEADIRLYGSYEPINGSGLDKDTLEIFSFADGVEGQALLDGHTFLVERILDKSTFVVLSVRENQPGWIRQNQELLMHIAESIVPIESGKK